MQCRTCGSQAFHVLDCCRDPDYAPVARSQIVAPLKAWVHGLWSRLRRPQRPQQQPAPEPLDAWETRPLLPLAVEGVDSSSVAAMHDTTEPEMHETVSAGR
jgi:hypothetical protein